MRLASVGFLDSAAKDKGRHLSASPLVPSLPAEGFLCVFAAFAVDGEPQETGAQKEHGARLGYRIDRFDH